MAELKVLHILSSRTYNGAENVVCQINSILKKFNADVELIYCSLDGPVRKSIEERGMRFIALKEISIEEIRRVVEYIKPNIVHAHDMRASFFVSLVCKNIPFVSHIHNNNSDSRVLSVKSVLYFLAALKAEHIFWVSKSSFNGYCFSRFIKNKSEILYNVVDVDELYSKIALDSKEYDYDAIYLGRLAYPKNPQRLVRIIKKIVENAPNFKVAIVGEGEDRREIQQFVIDNGFEQNVVFFGFLDNPYKILKTSKMMLMTSLWEGTPMCVLEALSLGIPVVSTPVDGLCDFIENNKNGYLSASDDELVEKCLELYMNKEVQQIMSNGALETANKSINTIQYGKKIIDVYKKCSRINR